MSSPANMPTNVYKSSFNQVRHEDAVLEGLTLRWKQLWHRYHCDAVVRLTSTQTIYLGTFTWNLEAFSVNLRGLSAAITRGTTIWWAVPPCQSLYRCSSTTAPVKGRCTPAGASPQGPAQGNCLKPVQDAGTLTATHPIDRVMLNQVENRNIIVTNTANLHIWLAHEILWLLEMLLNNYC